MLKVMNKEGIRCLTWVLQVDWRSWKWRGIGKPGWPSHKQEEGLEKNNSELMGTFFLS